MPPYPAAFNQQIGGTTRVVVAQPRNEDGTEQEARTHENVLVGPDGSRYVISDRPPEEAFAFGLPLGPRESFMKVQRTRLTTPSERGITRDRGDGLCVYCQLLLLPDAPEYAAHQPCMGLLIRNWERCLLCRLINTSIGRANPGLRARFEAGMDLGSSHTRIWVRSERFEKYSLMVAWMGDQESANIRGTPIVWATGGSLGSLSRRMIWRPHSDSEDNDPSLRLDVIKDWLRECQSKHVACNRSAGENRPLPTRVLKITPQDAPMPFTIQLHESHGESAPYIALSHCWGTSGPLRTLHSNLSQHKEGIAFEALPLSYGDIVAKTYYLGFQYLWIDSLCIIQDDSEDWEAEAARMASVYSNATLTFAATEAADPSEGCCPQYTRAFAIPLPDGHDALVRFQDNQNLSGKNAALNRRGWTMQEAALSRRMVCFDNDQLLWKCTSRHESEDGLAVVEEATPAVGSWNLWACLGKLGGGERSYAFWYGMMEDYSRRRHTFEKDRLPALAGMVKVFGEHVEDTPLLGLWKGDLVNGLLWRVLEPADRASSPGVVPSWSWTSVRGPVSWGGTFYSVDPGDKMEVVSSDVDWSGRPMTSSVAAVSLKVCGRMREAKVVRNAQITYLHEVDERPAPGDKKEEAPEILGYCYLDLAGSVGPRVWCLEVYHGLQRPGAEDLRHRAHRVLILEPLDESGDVFRRVGVGCVWRHSYRQDGSMDNAVKETFLGVPRRTVTIL